MMLKYPSGHWQKERLPTPARHNGRRAKLLRWHHSMPDFSFKPDQVSWATFTLCSTPWPLQSKFHFGRKMSDGREYSQYSRQGLTCGSCPFSFLNEWMNQLPGHDSARMGSSIKKCWRVCQNSLFLIASHITAAPRGIFVLIKVASLWRHLDPHFRKFSSSIHLTEQGNVAPSAWK